jgi:hypothetical protein
VKSASRAFQRANMFVSLPTPFDITPQASESSGVYAHQSVCAFQPLGHQIFILPVNDPCVLLDKFIVFALRFFARGTNPTGIGNMCDLVNVQQRVIQYFRQFGRKSGFARIGRPDYANAFAKVFFIWFHFKKMADREGLCSVLRTSSAFVLAASRLRSPLAR